MRFWIKHSRHNLKSQVIVCCRYFLAFLLLVPVLAHSEVLRLDYSGFTIWLDCDKHAAVMFRYNAQRDMGDLPRKSSFKLDPDVPDTCQQRRGYSYKTAEGEMKYDRGHMVPANHLDHDPVGIEQSNYMTNILPQTRQLNRGAWYETEKIIECARDTEELLVVGGPIWYKNNSKDKSKAILQDSHAIQIPDAYWKVVIGHKRHIAWIFPNDNSVKRGQLGQYAVSVADIEYVTHQSIPITYFQKKFRIVDLDIGGQCDQS